MATCSFILGKLPVQGKSFEKGYFTFTGSTSDVGTTYLTHEIVRLFGNLPAEIDCITLGIIHEQNLIVLNSFVS